MNRFWPAAAGVAAAAVVSVGAVAFSSAAPRTEAPIATSPTVTAGADGVVEYVNLGDSFSAATGVAPTAPGSPADCNRSARNFAHVVAQTRGYQLTDVSCGGAKTADFHRPQFPGLAPQLDALTPSTDLVTMTIGGNDNDTFATAIASCVGAAFTHPGAWNPCRDQYGDSLTEPVRSHTYPALLQALREVHSRAPQAEVAIVGYPWLLPPTAGCAPQMPLAAGDVPYLRDLQATLNDAVARAAAETGTTYVDMSQVSTGRDACQTPEQRWIEPLIGAQQPVPVHPNAAGAQAMADAVLAAIADR